MKLLKFLFFYSVGVIAWTIIIGFFKGHMEWDNLPPILIGGCIGAVGASFFQEKKSE
jgi:hypothetical protein